MNIQEDYVSFETAKLLKEKGFNEKVISFYPPGDIQRPTLQMVMKWLRLHHHLHIIVEVTWKDKIPHYQWRIEVLNTQHTIVDTPCCNKAEQACEAAIKYCLEKLI